MRSAGWRDGKEGINKLYRWRTKPTPITLVDTTPLTRYEICSLADNKAANFFKNVFHLGTEAWPTSGTKIDLLLQEVFCANPYMLNILLNLEARDGLQLVQSAARVRQTPAGDHRHLRGCLKKNSLRSIFPGS